MPGPPKQRTTTAWLGHLSRFPRAGTPPAEGCASAPSSGLSADHCNALIMLMEATTRIGLVYTVLQFYLGHAL